jgi:hypothetical protein
VRQLLVLEQIGTERTRQLDATTEALREILAGREPSGS